MTTPVERATMITADYLAMPKSVFVMGLEVVCTRSDIVSDRTWVEFNGGLEIDVPESVFESSYIHGAMLKYLEAQVLCLLTPLADESIHALELWEDEEPEWNPEHVPEVWR
jgi:hypothetical protein